MGAEPTPVIAGCWVKPKHPTIAGVTLLRHVSVRLRLLRQRHGVTQEEFAELAGVSYKFYQQIEAGRKKQIWLETVERLAAGFGLEAWQLLAPAVPAHTHLARPAQAGATPAALAEDAPTRRAVAEDPAPYGTQAPGVRKRVARKRKPASSG
jgi:transcriptional regulator with XRE-family HTH domain